MKSLVKIGRVAVIAAVFALPVLVYAVILPTPTVPTGGEGITASEIEDIIRYIAQFLIIVSVVIAVAAIIIGGIIWMTAGGNEERLGMGKKTVWRGILGALVVLGVGVILQTIAGLVTRNFFD